MVFVHSPANVSGIDSEDKKSEIICTGCHTTLAETLPKNHEVIGNFHLISCKRCHSIPDSTKTFEWLIHFKHYSIVDNEMDCTACHASGKEGNMGPQGGKASRLILTPIIVRQWKPYFESWADSGYMDNGHAQKGMSCSACHGSDLAIEAPSLEKCLSCHKTYDNAAVQNSNGLPNPHRSHLESPPCTLCHKAHEASINFCNTNNCHDFNFKFPYPNTK